MADEEKTVDFNLTLDPAPAAAQAAAAEAPAMPQLTLNEEEKAVEAPKEEIPVEKLDIESLSPAEQAAVREFAAKIDVTSAIFVVI